MARIRRPLSGRTRQLLRYQKQTMTGIIIYVNETNNWCNVELLNGDIIYRVPFRASNIRYRRLKQPVLLSQTVGSRFKYVITDAAERKIVSTEFADKGTFKWNDAGVTWNGFYQWG